jgi:hypothetical protein
LPLKATMMLVEGPDMLPRMVPRVEEPSWRVMTAAEESVTATPMAMERERASMVP